MQWLAYLGEVKHLPRLLQVARLLSLLGISLHLILGSILLGLLGVVGIVSLGDHFVLIEVLFQGVGDLLFNLGLLFSGQAISILDNHPLGGRSLSIHVDAVQGVSNSSS